MAVLRLVEDDVPRCAPLPSSKSLGKDGSYTGELILCWGVCSRLDVIACQTNIESVYNFSISVNLIIGTQTQDIKWSKV